MKKFLNPGLRLRDLLIIGLAVWITMLFFQLDEKKEAIEFVESEKATLNNEYTDLLAQYESLETDNDTLNTKLLAEREKIQKIIEELTDVKQAHASTVRKYKKELEGLRNIMKGFVQDIDSLNTLNQALIAENQVIKKDYQQATGKIKGLTEANQQLDDKVNKGAKIQAKDVDVIILNDADKVVNKDGEIVKAKKVAKIKVLFKLRENPLAKAGVRDVFLRIVRPDGLLLTSDNGGTFTYEGQDIASSTKREVDYKNEDVSMNIIWKRNQELPEGDYSVDIFIDGNQIGKGSFSLK